MKITSAREAWKNVERRNGGGVRRIHSASPRAVLRVGDANDIERIEHALDIFRETRLQRNCSAESEPRYRVLAKEVVLDVSSPLLHFDEHGLPMHGVPWSLLPWVVTEAKQDFLAARLEWSSSELLAVFPFRHRVELAAALRPDSVTLETTLVAGSEGPVPVSFGFHPYLGLPELSRSKWRLELPAMRKIALDRRGIPTGDEEPFGGINVAQAFASCRLSGLEPFSRGESRFRHMTRGSLVYWSQSLSNQIATSKTLLISPTSRELPDINPSGTTVANNYFSHTTNPAQP